MAGEENQSDKYMVYDEKRQLHKDIHKLPEELFGTLVKIVLARESGIEESDDGEIEIDLEALKTSTLRALEKFIKFQSCSLHGICVQVLQNNIDNIDECLKITCVYEGTCVNTVGSFYCECPPGRTNVDCRDDINECLDNPCLNGGTCFNSDGSYCCTCTPSWEGQDCQIDINECLDNPCLNGGTCFNTDGSYRCQCTPFWEGQHCHKEIDECVLGHNCENGATCINVIGTYTCICPAGYTGPFCFADVNECLHNPCLNGGTCINNFGSFVCHCHPSFKGKLCEFKHGRTVWSGLRLKSFRQSYCLRYS